MTKQFALDERFRQRCAVYFDQRPIKSGTFFVDRPRNELLADAGLSLQQHGSIRLGHLLHTREHVFQSVAFPDDLLETLDLRNLLFQINIFLFQPLLQALDLDKRRLKISFGTLTLSYVEQDTHSASAVEAGVINSPASRCNPSLGAVRDHRTAFIFERVASPLRALDLGNDARPVVGMNTVNHVFESEHIVVAKAKQGSQTLVSPEFTALQIARPQAQLAGAG